MGLYFVSAAILVAIVTFVRTMYAGYTIPRYMAIILINLLIVYVLYIVVLVMQDKPDINEFAVWFEWLLGISICTSIAISIKIFYHWYKSSRNTIN
jgi:hypothetical protein